MYSRISIKNFRGIGWLEVDGLRRINLIVGRNNWGKTTFLEGLFLLGGANDPRYATVPGSFAVRGRGAARTRFGDRCSTTSIQPRSDQDPGATGHSRAAEERENSLIPKSPAKLADRNRFEGPDH